MTKTSLAKPRAQRIIDGVIHDGLPARSDRINLFQAPVTAAHAGGEDHQRRLARRRSTEPGVLAHLMTLPRGS